MLDFMSKQILKILGSQIEFECIFSIIWVLTSLRGCILGLTNLDALAMIHKNSPDDTQPRVVICSNTLDEFFNNKDVLLGKAKDEAESLRRIYNKSSSVEVTCMHSNFLSWQYNWHMGAWLPCLLASPFSMHHHATFFKHVQMQMSNIVTQVWCATMQHLRQFWIASVRDNNLLIHFYVVIVDNASFSKYCTLYATYKYFIFSFLFFFFLSSIPKHCM